jgi:gamma-glutamylaminecyclotransferase
MPINQLGLASPAIRPPQPFLLTMTNELNQIVFVYGSLKQGQRLHHAIQGQQFLGNSTTCPDYALYDCGDYPALVKVAANGESVKGELYRVDSNCLQNLDNIECVDEGLYCRKPVDLLPRDDEDDSSDIVWAWFYLQSIDGLRRCGNQWP